MKSVLLVITKEDVRGVATLVTSTQFIKDAVNTPAPQSGGFNIEEMQKRIRILNAVDAIDKKEFKFEGTFKEDELEEILKKEALLELEDADMKNLGEIMKSARFGIVSQHIIDLNERIKKEAETVK